MHAAAEAAEAAEDAAAGHNSSSVCSAREEAGGVGISSEEKSEIKVWNNLCLPNFGRKGQISVAAFWKVPEESRRCPPAAVIIG